jgi:hypothetical protein
MHAMRAPARRRLTAAVLGGLAMGGLAVGVVATRPGRPPAIALAGEPGWSKVTPTDVFEAFGPTYLAAVFPWGDHLVIQAISVAATHDLVTWRMRGVSPPGTNLTPLLAPGPDGSVVLVTPSYSDLADHAVMSTRVWTSRDLATWTELTGDSRDTMVDGQVETIAVISGRIVLAGSVEVAGPPTGEIQQRHPAIWTSTKGSPFHPVLLGPAPGPGEHGGSATGVAPTRAGAVAFGSLGGDGRAWTTTDLATWTLASEPVPGPDGPSWMLPPHDGSLLGGGAGGAWISTDDGATWRVLGSWLGPQVATIWRDRIVGISASRQLWLWTDVP